MHSKRGKGKGNGISVETEWAFLIRWLVADEVLSDDMAFDLKSERSQRFKKIGCDGCTTVNMLKRYWVVHFKWVNRVTSKAYLEDAFLFRFCFLSLNAEEKGENLWERIFSPENPSMIHTWQRKITLIPISNKGKMRMISNYSASFKNIYSMTKSNPTMHWKINPQSSRFIPKCKDGWISENVFVEFSADCFGILLHLWQTATNLAA